MKHTPSNAYTFNHFTPYIYIHIIYIPLFVFILFTHFPSIDVYGSLFGFIVVGVAWLSW